MTSVLVVERQKQFVELANCIGVVLGYTRRILVNRGRIVRTYNRERCFRVHFFASEERRASVSKHRGSVSSLTHVGTGGFSL